MSRISIIGVPMDLGADRRGVDMGPSALRYASLNEKLKELQHDVEDLGDLDVIIPEIRHFGDPHAKYLKEIADSCTHLANLVLQIYERGRTPIVLGGDHCVEVSGRGRQYRSQLPSASEEALMQEELVILGHDPVYERALTA